MTTELCENCGKPKEEHYYLELFNEWCCTPTEDIYNSDRFTPKKSNDSHSSQSGSKTNDKTSSENHSSFKTLKSSGSDTISSLIEKTKKEIEDIKNADKELKKISDALYFLEDGKTREPKGKENIEKWKLVMKEHNKVLKRCKYPMLKLAQTRLQALNECAKMIEKMIEEIWTINGTGCFYLKGINNNEVRRVERLKKFASQLKQEKEKEIGGIEQECKK